MLAVVFVVCSGATFLAETKETWGDATVGLPRYWFLNVLQMHAHSKWRQLNVCNRSTVRCRDGHDTVSTRQLLLQQTELTFTFTFFSNNITHKHDHDPNNLRCLVYTHASTHSITLMRWVSTSSTVATLIRPGLLLSTASSFIWGWKLWAARCRQRTCDFTFFSCLSLEI